MSPGSLLTTTCLFLRARITTWATKHGHCECRAVFSVGRGTTSSRQAAQQRNPAIIGVMAREYVEERNGGYYLAGTRISLDSIVQCFNERLSPEAILAEFETLTLTQVFVLSGKPTCHRRLSNAPEAALRGHTPGRGTPSRESPPAPRRRSRTSSFRSIGIGETPGPGR